MQTGKAVMATDLVIILLSMAVFRNIESGLYGLINMVVGTYVIDVILYGMNKSTMITVISPRSTEIAKELMRDLERGCTLLKSRGAYREEEGETVICVLDKKQFYRAKKIVYGIDPTAFMIVSEAQEVYGRFSGFRLGSVKIKKRKDDPPGNLRIVFLCHGSSGGIPVTMTSGIRGRRR